MTRRADSFLELTPPPGAASVRVTNQPALDGLRGFAVAAAVAFHLDLGVFTGGFLGVSLFFTLSGFLVGTIVLAEITGSGGFSLRHFADRRSRRLLPAALVTVGAVAIARAITTVFTATSDGDIVAAATGVSNWQLLATDTSYGDLFAGPPALLHFWSLAIEAQFYVVAGLLAVVVCRFARRPVRAVGIGAAVLAAVSFALPAVAGLGVDRTYYGTDTRAGELLVGVALAAITASSARRTRLVAATRPVAVAGAAAGLGTVAFWWFATAGTGWLRHGLLPVTAVLSVVAIVGALMPSGPLQAIAQLAPVRWIGRLSYGIYLAHWPVLVAADRLTTDRSLLRAAAIVAVSVAIAQGSIIVMERPVRRRTVSWSALSVAGVVLLGAIGLSTAAGARRTESDELLSDLDAAPELTGSPSLGSGATDDADLPRVAVFGDSIAFTLVMAMGGTKTDADFTLGVPDVAIGCGIATSPSPPVDEPGRCDNPAERYAAVAANGDADLAVMLSCQWELVAQAIPGSKNPAPYTVGDAEFDRYLSRAYDAIVDSIRAAGVDRILWVRCPHFSQNVGVDGLSNWLAESREPERVDALNALIDDLATGRDDVDTLALDEWVDARIDDTAVRPDGSHFRFDAYNPVSDVFVKLVNTALAD